MSCISMEEYIEVEEISLGTKQHLRACNYYIPRRQVSCEARFVSLQRDSAGTRTSLRPTLVVYLRTFYLRQATGRFRFREVISSMRLPCLGLALSLSFQSLLRPVWSREISPILVSAVRVMSLDDTFPRKGTGVFQWIEETSRFRDLAFPPGPWKQIAFPFSRCLVHRSSLSPLVSPLLFSSCSSTPAFNFHGCNAMFGSAPCGLLLVIFQRQRARRRSKGGHRMGLLLWRHSLFSRILSIVR